ncbi:MAG TPA: D-2-hydroxyacid dehydrogenase [Thermomicrobiales bacterium]|nr:D-2-hydroxyacid dehydrogenase [Thermomicrobiales bacterium]
MDRTSLEVLVAMPVEAAGLARVKKLAGVADVACIEPFGPDDEVPAGMLRHRTVLFADFAPRNLAEMTALRWIQLGSAGYEQMVGLPLREMGVRLTNASGVNDVAIAEWCVLMMLAFERDLAAVLSLQARHVWDRPARFQSELRGRRVGIVGYGNIGRETARLCAALGLEVWAMNRGPIGPRPHRYGPPGTGDPTGSLPARRFDVGQVAEFLPVLDYLIVTVALTPGSRHLLGERELNLLPPSAVLLNPSRAQVVEEQALLRALRTGRIAGAALDSHYREPLPPDDPFWDLPNVVITPHISGSGASPHYRRRLWELFAVNLEHFARGEPLLNEIVWSDLEPLPATGTTS